MHPVSIRKLISQGPWPIIDHLRFLYLALLAAPLDIKKFDILAAKSGGTGIAGTKAGVEVGLLVYLKAKKDRVYSNLSRLRFWYSLRSHTWYTDPRRPRFPPQRPSSRQRRARHSSLGSASYSRDKRLCHCRFVPLGGWPRCTPFRKDRKSTIRQR